MEVDPDDRCPICFETKADNVEAVWVGHRDPIHFYHANCAYRWTLRDFTQLSRCPSLPCKHILDSASLRPFISEKIIYQEQIDALKDLVKENAPSLIANSMQVASLAALFSSALSNRQSILNKEPHLIPDIKLFGLIMALHLVAAITNSTLPNTLSIPKNVTLALFLSSIFYSLLSLN